MLVGRFSAVLDANVLHSATVRMALLRMAQENLFQPLWSEKILDEMVWSLKARRRDSAPGDIDRIRETLERTYDEAMVVGQRHIQLSSPIPDEDDRHVFETAVAGKADAIVTFNLKDFPLDVAADLGVEIKHPDEFMVNLIDLDQDKALKALREQRSKLKRPPVNGQEFLKRFFAARMVQTVQRLTPLVSLI